MDSKIWLPERKVIEYALLNVIAEQRVLMIRFVNPENFKNQVLSLSGRKFLNQYNLIVEIEKIVKGAESTEIFCIEYIIITEIICKLIEQKREGSKHLNKTEFADDFIKIMDSVIGFRN